MTSVSDKAREAAGEMMERWQGESRECFISGEYDQSEIVQAFARFEAEALERAATVLDDRVKLAKTLAERNPTDARVAALMSYEVAAQMIRQLKGSGDE